ncbi:MAG TPA: DUF4157 domain-containing protein [Candidatus Methanoperedens sp.]
MGDAVKVVTKAPVANKENKASKTRKPELSRSIDSPVEQALFLQRTIGNRAVERLIKSGSLQAKLRIGRPGDIYEQEADRVADAVMRMPEPDISNETKASNPAKNNSIQRKCPWCNKGTKIGKEEDEEKLQKKDASGSTPEVTPKLESSISGIRGGGLPLPKSVRAFFEPRFGHDFSQVQVHTDAKAAESARVMNARAFTVGQDVVFGTGQYAPGTSEGRRLMAHELTHVIQQSATVGEKSKKSAPELRTKIKQKILQSTDKPFIMHSLLFSSTMEICHRLLKSRVFHVSQGNVTVIANARWSYPPHPLHETYCKDDPYNITLTKKNRFIDDEYGTCEFASNRVDAGTWTGLAEGDYYLTIWRNNDDPYCCLTGKIQVSEQSEVKGSSCTKRGREAERETEIRVVLPSKSEPAAMGRMMVTPENATSIGQRLAKGQSGLDPGFAPKNGGSMFFVSQGNPYTGVVPEQSVAVEVRVRVPSDALSFNDATLLDIHAEKLTEMFKEKGAKLSEGFNGALRNFLASSPRRAADFPYTAESLGISNTALRRLLNPREGIAQSERLMWDHIGRTVRDSGAGIGRVIMSGNSHVSRGRAGEFLVVSIRDAAKVKITGGGQQIVDAMMKTGAQESATAKVKETIAREVRVGKVKGAFRVGGRILFVIGVTTDFFSFIFAKDKLKEITRIAGGWTGGLLAGGAFAAWFTPADTAGPWAWVAHGLGSLIAFGVGYWAGSEVTTWIYEITIED